MAQSLMFLHKEQYTVRSYETGPDGLATVQTIVNYLQNSGFNHAVELRTSGGLAHDPSTAYFLTRQRVRIYRYPEWRETITLQTWLDPRIEKYAVREFELTDSAGEVIGCATNSALFYNIHEKKTIPASERMINIPVPPRGRALDDPFDPIPRPSVAEFSAEFNTRLADLDMYNHVNNVVYVEWAVETLPQGVWNGWTLRDHEINFRAETGPGDFIQSEAEEITCGEVRIFLHRLTRKSDGKEVALLRTWWEKNKK